MPTFPQPLVPVFPAGYGPLPADFTTWVQNSFGFLTNEVMFRAIQTTVGGQSLSGIIFAALHPDTVLEDPYSGWSQAGNANQAAWSWLAPYTGWYEITVNIPTQAGATMMAAAIQVSGGTALWMDNSLCPAGSDGGASGSVMVPLTGGVDYVIFGAALVGVASTDTTSFGVQPGAEVTYISGG